jgi:hypothetical protein
MYFKNEWFSYYYENEVIPGVKPSTNALFKINFKKTVSRPLKTYKEELLLNAQATRDAFSEPFDLMLSGGIDSEIILKCYLELKIPINVFIFKYEDDINIVDVTNALNICKELNVTPVVIDFNLQHFIENEAHEFWKLSLTNSLMRTVQMKMISYLDNIPIMGDGLCALSNTMIQENNIWKYCISERQFGQTIYCKHIDRPMLTMWYMYSPEVLLSFTNSPIIKRFEEGKLILSSFNEIKYFNLKQDWSFKIRPKLTGFESLQDFKIKKYISEFDKKYTTDVKCTEYNFTSRELRELL